MLLLSAVPFVGATKIFARHTTAARQVLAYSMDIELDEELAMVLPLPVPARSREDAVEFIDLEGYERFFVDLDAAFPEVFQGAKSRSLGFRSFAEPPPKLAVHDVGMFEASFVPTRADFARLDERFRFPEGIWDALPAYADWGFAVFQLKPKKGFFGRRKRQSIHPMAFSFPTREPDALYFPLLHIHDGHVGEYAAFDHMLYCQASGVLASTIGWFESNAPLSQHVDVARARQIVDVQKNGFKLPLSGSLPNEDLWLRAPPGVRVEDLRGQGECYAYEVTATKIHVFRGAEPRYLRWQEATTTRLAALCRGLREGLRELEAQRRASWRLAPLHDDLPDYFMNGQQLWSGTSYLNGTRAEGQGRGRVRFSPFSENVPVQSVTLGFTRLPDETLAIRIQQELSQLLDRAIAN